MMPYTDTRLSKKNGALDKPEAPCSFDSHSVTQTRPNALPVRVSVFDADTPVQNPVTKQQKPDTTCGERLPQWEDCTGPQTPPVTRGPLDVWHSEEYLLGWLVKTHGWRVVEPGLLQRYRTDRSPCSVEAA